MSIFVTARIVATDPELAIAHFAQSSFDPDLVSGGAAPFARPALLSVYGLAPNVSAYLELDKTRPLEARAAIAEVVRRYLAISRDDLVVTYVDTIIVKRVGELWLNNRRFLDFVPVDQPWSVAREIPELRRT
jgi:hypothetical protein|nr:hypothetical protein [Kofleriaceae bacterium]